LAASISSAVRSADRPNLPSPRNFDETFITPSSWRIADLNPVVFALAAPRKPSIWSNVTQSRVGKASAEKEAIVRIDGVVPVGGNGIDAVVIAVLIVMEKGIVHIARKRGGGIAERDRVRRVVRSHQSHRVLDVVPPSPPGQNRTDTLARVSTSLPFEAAPS
jgi:hypothetical protein